MGRYIKDFYCTAPSQTVFEALNNYLLSEKYEYVNFDGENVFKKGDGFFAGPTFFKFTFYQEIVRVESWTKYAFLPGVYVGEIEGSGIANKNRNGALGRRTFEIERIITSFGGMAYPQPVNIPVADASVNFNVNSYNVICMNCGNSVIPNNGICPVCAVPLPSGNVTPAVGNISRKEFIENYLPKSEKRNINSIAYLCYFCAAITTIFGIFTEPLAIIDAVILAGLALGMQLTKHRVFSILLLIFSIIEMILGIFAGSYPVWWLAAGIAAFVVFNKIEKKYKQFTNKQ